jgi:hypothetical protein
MTQEELEAKNIATLQQIQAEIDVASDPIPRLKSLILQSRFRWYTSPEMDEKYQKGLSRSAHKLLWYIHAGYKLGREIDNLPAIAFMSTVTPYEMTMTDAQYASGWTDKAAISHLKIRVKDGLDLVKGKPKIRAKAKTKHLICQKCDEVFESHRRSTKYCPSCAGRIDPSKRYCALGKNCLNSTRNIPKLALPGKQYCSDTCLGSAQASRKRAMAKVDALVGRQGAS